MEVRYGTHPTDALDYDTKRLRSEYLIEDLFQLGEVKFVYTHEDRLVIGGAVPTDTPILLEPQDEFRTAFFLERRELGIINIGGTGRVRVDEEEFMLQRRDCLYIGRGRQSVQFASDEPTFPAHFYLVSAPAHKTHPTRKMSLEEADREDLGLDAKSNNRTIHRFVHGGGIQSCQLMLGMTLLKPNNMWNTMPAHVHDRRMEAYLYFDLAEDERVFHLMGEPDNTRHIVVKNEQVVISPSWSIHSGVGTSHYTFIWAMAGENYTFSDMDHVPMAVLR